MAIWPGLSSGWKRIPAGAITVVTAIIQVTEHPVIACEPARSVGVFASIKKPACTAIVKQGFEFLARHTPVQWNQDGAQPGAGEQQFEEFDAVAAQQGDAVTARNTEVCEQGSGPAGALMQFTVGDFNFADNILEGQPVRAQHGAAGEYIENRKTHGCYLGLIPLAIMSVTISATLAAGTLSSHSV